VRYASSLFEREPEMPNIFVPREIREGETRAAAVPETVQRLTRDGFAVSVQRGAGVGAMIADEAFERAGARLSEDPASAYAAADIVAKLHPPMLEEAAWLREGSLLVSHVWPFENKALCERLMERRVTVFAMDQIPRTPKAQYMDALSSQMNIAGYKAVILAAEKLRKVVPLMMTAAGTINPAKVVVMGAEGAGGVARRQVHRAARHGRGRGRLRGGAVRGLPDAAAGDGAQAPDRRRRGDHHRQDPGH
jgi:NAD(P) transhydrogenase subunit alpha